MLEFGDYFTKKNLEKYAEEEKAVPKKPESNSKNRVKYRADF